MEQAPADTAPPADPAPAEQAAAPAPPAAQQAAEAVRSPEKVARAIALFLESRAAHVQALAVPILGQFNIPSEPEILDRLLAEGAALLESLRSDDAAPLR